MKKTFKNKALKLSVLASVASSALLVSCGGGGSGSGSSATERPKTLDDLILTFDELNISLEFRRSEFSPVETSLSAPETGSVGYTFVNTENIEVSLGTNVQMEVAWPENFTNLTYTYRPTSDVSGTLTLHSEGGTFVFGTGNNAGHTAFPFDASINYTDAISHFPDSSIVGTTQFNPTYELTFINNGVSITSVDIIARPESIANTYIITGGTTFLVENDVSYVTSSILRTSAGAVVPVNYTQDEQTGSIADTGLDAKTLQFTPVATGSGTGLFLNSSFEYTFSNDGALSFGNEEEGSAVYTDIANGQLFPTVNVSYEYEFTDGSDLAELVLEADGSGPPVGEYSLFYTSLQTDPQGNPLRQGTYTISAPGTTYDGETGTFIVRL